MDNSGIVTLTRQAGLLREMQTVANNIANISTAGFRAEGVIFLGQSFLHERFNQLAETESRFIVWGAEIPGQKYCSVGSDNLRGGKRVTSHLLNLGRRRIAFVGDTSNPEILQRYEGYISAHRRADIPLDADLTLQSSFDVESAEAAISSLMQRGVTSVSYTHLTLPTNPYV